MLKSLMMGAVVLSTLAIAACDSSQSKTTTYSASLDGKSEVPSVTTNATGQAKLTLDRASKTLSWEITYKDLSGNATAAHLHGPAKAGANAGVVVPVGTTLASPIRGSAVVSDAVIGQLDAGDLYVNIHTAANPNGEIRGQVKK